MNIGQATNGFWGWGLNNSQGASGITQKQLDDALQKALGQTNYGFGQMSSDPFASAMSGNQQGTLQPFINRQTNNAYNALNSGLLGYSPQAMQAGNASGTPITVNDPKASQFNLQGLLSNFEGFGNRSWMDK